jgi:hypothetical protein
MSSPAAPADMAIHFVSIEPATVAPASREADRAVGEVGEGLHADRDSDAPAFFTQKSPPLKASPTPKPAGMVMPNSDR